MKTIAPKLELVVDAGNYIGESPIWVAREQAVYWINLEHPPELHRWGSASGEHRVWPMPQRIGGVAPTAAGGLIVALANGLYDFNPADGNLKLRVRSPLPPHIALHETGVDRQGRLWVGGYGLNLEDRDKTPKDAALMRLDSDRLVRMQDGVKVSNGLAFSPDGRTLYHTDCMTGVLDRYDLDPATGNISNRREFVRFSLDEGVMDGAAVDRDGGYWSAVMMAGRIRRFLPDGTLDLEVQVPLKYPSMIAFGGPDLDTLYVTTGNLQHGGGERDALKSGGLFRFKPGFKGLPQPLVK